ncbi:MAG: Plastocyanin [Candidatus Nomurabacteria bacterium GW2011_GWB1_37_5]|uniref:Plastocyanin n=1 Tax=Candidatus Nomurabacteria bacterium GW2011_GWB1_37_5 TaxID=1618742 RepID=A0A0G0JGY7_9BACT|nr:MAG: Plastocyanin [Candidatus Nomurabacteria bacterium GW2011_GWB1_37_5]
MKKTAYTILGIAIVILAFFSFFNNQAKDIQNTPIEKENIEIAEIIPNQPDAINDQIENTLPSIENVSTSNNNADPLKILTLPENTVIYTSTGFSPETFEAVIGTKVKFENQSDRTFWVASDPHPIHTDLPGFDAGRPIQRFESYEFTFNKTGTFRYHDHSRPSYGGTIIIK